MKVRTVVLVAALGLIVVVVGVWLMLDNPTIATTTKGAYECSAPYDTVLNSDGNFPGGEPPPNGQQIASECRDAGQLRFTIAAAALAVGVVSLSASGVVGLQRKRRST